MQLDMAESIAPARYFERSSSAIAASRTLSRPARKSRGVTLEYAVDRYRKRSHVQKLHNVIIRVVNGVGSRLRNVIFEPFAETLGLALQILSIWFTHNLLNWTLGHDASFLKDRSKWIGFSSLLMWRSSLGGLSEYFVTQVLVVARDHIREADAADNR